MSKKSKKRTLPKRIGGVKVPKAVRKGRFGKLIASKTGQALIAEALMAAVAAGAAKKAKDSPKARSFAHDVAEKVRDHGSGKPAAATSAALAYALGEAVRSFADALRNGQNGRGEEDRAELEPDWRSGAGAAPLEGGDGKKKPSSYEAGPI